MKMTVILISVVCTLLIQTQKLQGQENVAKPGQADKQVASRQADSTAKKGTDVAVNMEMIESFHRCYDKIEVINWDSILINASSDELRATFMAYRRLQKDKDANNDTKTLVAETQKVKTEIASAAPIMLKNTEDKETIASTDLEINVASPK